MFKEKKRLILLISLLLFAVSGTLQAKPTLQDSRYFPETGFGIAHDVIWDYFQSRGGVDTFGYPVSDLFTYRGFEVQIFQRHVLQINGQQVRPLNLLDPDVMPIYTFGGLTFPEYDESVARQAPAPDTANYGSAVRQHLEANVPERWQAQSVGFLSYYLSAAPDDAGNLGTLLALEVWGFPTSQPKPDPNNQNFIYQRFQRGIMHYDASSQVTAGILLGDAFKQMIESAGTEPTDDSPEELVGNTLILYAVEEGGQWALESWPDDRLLSDPIFDRFYGELVLPELFPMYFLNYHPKLSPNGRYLLLPGIGGDPPPAGDLGSGMWLVDLIERKSRQLLPQAQIATWSPQSDQITYVRGESLWTLNISENSSPVALFTHPELSQLYAHWSPDGSSIAVATVSATETIDYEGIPLRKESHWLIPTNGDAPRQITNQPAFPMEHATTEIEWSHDGQFLLLKLHGLLYNLAGEQVLALLPPSQLADWVPNKTDLLRSTFDGMEIITLEGEVVTTISQAGAQQFAFSNDGQRLAYTQKDANGQSRLKVFELDSKKKIDVATFSSPSAFNFNMLNSSTEAKASIVYQQNDSVWIVPAEANQSPIELFSSGLLVGVVPMP